MLKHNSSYNCVQHAQNHTFYPELLAISYTFNASITNFFSHIVTTPPHYTDEVDINIKLLRKSFQLRWERCLQFMLMMLWILYELFALWVYFTINTLDEFFMERCSFRRSNTIRHEIIWNFKKLYSSKVVYNKNEVNHFKNHI